MVTGATGNVGHPVLRHLKEWQVPVRAMVRNPERAAERLGTGAAPGSGGSVELRRFDFLTDTPGPELFDGVGSLFLMRPPDIGEVKRYLFPFLVAAREAGVRYVVFLSLLGAEKLPVIPHRKVELEIQRLGLPHTFLRAGFFMQNLDTVFREFIRTEDVLPVPAGRGKTSFVDSRDLGEAAARLLLQKARQDPGVHGAEGRTVPGPSQGPSASGPAAAEWRAPILTGTEALDYHRVAELLSAELGRDIVYTRPGLGAFRRKALGAGWDTEYVKIVGRLFYTVRFGMAAKVSDDLGRILGRPPRSLAEYIHDYRESWSR